MELSHVMHVMIVVTSGLLLATVLCEEEQAAVQLPDLNLPQTQKRSVMDLAAPPSEDSFYPGYLPNYPPIDPEEDTIDKRSSLFRFGKRGSLFRFGKRGTLFRFGKRGSLFRFGKRGSLFRFGKRNDDDQGEWEMYPDVYVTDDVAKRSGNSFHWGRDTEE